MRRRRRTVLALWIAALVVAAPLAAKQSENLTGGGFDVPGSQSSSVRQDLARFPHGAGANLAVVLDPRPDARPGDLRRAVADVSRTAAGADDVEVDRVSLRAARARARAAPDRPVLIGLAGPRGDDEATDVATDLRDDLDLTESHPGHAAGGRVDVHLAGQGALWAAVQVDTKKNVQVAETRAFPLIALVLLAGFGSLAATVLPLSLGMAAVTLSGALIFLLSLATQMSVFVTSVASMLGLGVAVDYSLFVLVRYREEIARGRAPEQALGAALATSGVAVAFSGLTVVTSMAGLFFVDSTALRSVAAGAIVVVAVSVLGASTLLPALIAALGRRGHEPGRLERALERRRRRRDRPPEREFWARWSAAVMRRPVLSVVAAAAVLLTLGIPALDMNIENPGLEQVGSGDPYRDGVRTAGSIVGPGALGPVQVVVSTRRGGEVAGPAGRRAVARVRAATRRDRVVRSVSAPQVARDGRSALLLATLRVEPSSEAARDAVRRLRDRLPGAAGGRASVEVGGTTGALMDFDDLVNGSLWKIALFVLALSFGAMLLLLRSIVLPLKAVLMTMLSVISAYGVVVAGFQWGWLDFLGLDSARYVDTLTPPLVLVIAFGLSMDYEVFLLSRIRERYLATGDTRRSVTEGLTTTARTITSAALIMVVVFLAFVSAGLPAVQRLGVASAAAIALDATLVRLVLVPAAMVLLDRWNWWLPRPLERLLPGGGLEQLGGGPPDARSPSPAAAGVPVSSPGD
ncbi:MAG TPA: MMPL family transporter [Thermoleophilaceae bacterium]